MGQAAGTGNRSGCWLRLADRAPAGDNLSPFPPAGRTDHVALPHTTFTLPDVSLSLAGRARLSPLAPAMLELASPTWRTTTYAELDSRSNAIAHGLSDLGLSPGDRAALLVPPGRDLVATFFTLLRVGAVP